MEKYLIANQRKCTKCGEIVISHRVHDYVTCTCGITSVDGGNHYQKYTINNDYPSIDLSIYSDAPFEIIRQHLYRGTRGINGDQALTWIKLCDMDTDHIEACIKYNEERGVGGKYTPFYEQELKYRKENGTS